MKTMIKVALVAVVSGICAGGVIAQPDSPGLIFGLPPPGDLPPPPPPPPPPDKKSTGSGPIKVEYAWVTLPQEMMVLTLPDIGENP